MTAAFATPVPMPELTYGLADPAEAGAMTGLAILCAIRDGRLPAPPFAGTMRQWIAEAEEGRAVFLADPDPRYLNPMGLIHGGWTMTLLDSALGCAVQTVLGRGEGYVSLGTEVKFVRPVLPGAGQLRCEARVESRGSRTATASGRVLDGAGRVMATGTTTCFLRGAEG